jgi:hypothetical protein
MPSSTCIVEVPFEISGFHGGKHEDYSFLEYSTV